MSTDDRPVAADPADLERLFVQRVNDGDVDGLVALFEDDAVMAVSPGRTVTGAAAIRRFFEEYVASGVTLTLGDQQPSLRTGDIVLTSTRLADGGVTAEVARRQPDGSWRWILDQWNVLA
jgi:ketosteroid isomerase-like protein